MEQVISDIILFFVGMMCGVGLAMMLGKWK